MSAPDSSPSRPWYTAAGVALLVLVSAIAAAIMTWSQEGPRDPTRLLDSADATRGQGAFVEYGCVACHSITGVTGADGRVGPPLDGWAHRQTVAGRLPNTPENLVDWIMSPQEIDPGNVMPDMGVPEVTARDMAAYLYRLK